MKQRTVIWPVLGTLLLAFSLVSGSCSVLFATLFGDEIMYADATTMLFELVPELEGARKYGFAIRRLNAAMLDSLAIYLVGEEISPRVILLDPKSLEHIRTISPADIPTVLDPNPRFFEQMSVASASRYCLGNFFFDLTSKSITGFSDQLQNIEGAGFVASYLHEGTHGLYYSRYDELPSMAVCYNSTTDPDGYSSMSLSISPPLQVPATNFHGAFVASCALENRLLFIIQNRDDRSLWKFSIDPADPSSAITSIPIPLDISNLDTDDHSPRIWLTPEGLIARQNHSSSLTRFDLDTGMPLDSLQFDDRNNYIHFESDGSAFYVFNRSTGLLSKAKTWWKR